MLSNILNILRWIILICGILSAFLLIASSTANYISPTTSSIPALLGLAFPFLLTLNVIFLLIWGIFRRKSALYPLIGIVLSLPTNFSFISINNSSVENGIESFKLLSYNVRNFDLYNWTSNKKTRNSIFNFMRNENSDLLCIQEFFHASQRKEDFNTLDSILKFEKSKYHHIAYSINLHNSTHHWGIATFSKYPIVNKGRLNLPQGGHNICIFSDIVVNKDTIRLYNMHLASIKFQQSDYEFIDGISEKNNQEQIDGSVHLLSKLKQAFIQREIQVKLLLENIATSPYKVVVCGDLNDTPASFAYHLLNTDLKDAFLESGYGIGKTYNGSFPSYRIDYILTSPNINSTNFNIHPVEMSDHFPISCSLKLP